MHRPRISRAAALALGLLVSACGSGGFASMAPSVSAGVTTGGAQDIGLARQHVASGVIPPPESFVVEGLLSEHDIDIGAPACDDEQLPTFCVHSAVAVAPSLDTGRDAAFMVLGLSSSIDLARFQRKPLNLSVVVDRSGSMQGAKILAARRALHALLGKLGPRDRLSIVIFDDDVDVLLPSTRLTHGTASLHAVVDQIQARGSTDIESALAEGFDLVGEHLSEDAEDRVILITDARPNTGQTDDDSFMGLAEAWARQGVGLTVMGVGLDFGQDLVVAISALPGGSYHFLESAQKLAKVFDRRFDLLVSPLAWDVEIAVDPLPGFHVAEVYGAPGDAAVVDGAFRIEVPTLFLSENRGAIVLRLEPDEGWELGTQPVARPRMGWRSAPQAPRVYAFGEPSAPRDDNPGVSLAVALVNTALGMRAAASLAHEGRTAEAHDVLDSVEILTDSGGLDAERRLVQDLRALLPARGRVVAEGPDHPERRDL